MMSWQAGGLVRVPLVAAQARVLVGERRVQRADAPLVPPHSRESIADERDGAFAAAANRP